MASPWIEWRTPPLPVRAAGASARALAPLLRLARIEPLAFERILVARVSLEVRGDKAPRRFSAVLTLVLCTLSGLVPAALAYLIEDPYLWSLQELTLTTCILSLGLFFQLSNLLLDGTDLHVIGPLPVPERTLYAARIAHTLLYASALAACIHAFPLLAAGLRFGPRAWLALPPAAALATVFAVAAVALVHALLLRLFGPERHRRATLWAQIVLGVCVMVGGQIWHRVIDFEALFQRLGALPRLVLAFPPAWFAGVFAALMGQRDRIHAELAGLALAAPVLALACALALARRDLIAGLSLGGGGAAARPWSTSFFQRLGRRIASGPAERAGYDWALCVSRREPAFLRTAYPQIASYSILGISFFFSSGSFDRELAPYLPFSVLLIVPTVLELSAFSERPADAGCLLPLPLEPRGRFYAGTLKGLLAGTALPAYVLLLTVAALLCGLAALPGLLLSASLIAWLALVLARLERVPLPFSRQMRYGASGNVDVGRVILALLVSVGAGLLYALLGLVPGGRLAGAAVAALLAVREWRALERTLVRRGGAMEEEFLHRCGATEAAS